MIEMIFILNIFCSFFMCGLIWLVQLVHYPFFLRAERSQFIDHIQFHGIRISFVVLPVMITELISSVLLTLYAPSFQAVHFAGLIIVILIWMSTFLLQVPQHASLSNGFDEKAIMKLVSTNWIRTIFWSVKSVLSLYILVSVL